MIRTEQNRESVIPAMMPLHTTLGSNTDNGIWKTRSKAEEETDEPTEDSTIDSQTFSSAADTISVTGSSRSMSPTPQTPSSVSSSGEVSGLKLKTGHSSVGSSLHRLKIYREQRRANLHEGFASPNPGHSSGQRRQSQRLVSLSGKNERDLTEMVSPHGRSASDRSRQRTSLRAMNRTSGSGPNKRTSGNCPKRGLGNIQVQPTQNLTPCDSVTTTPLRRSVCSGMSSLRSSISTVGSSRRNNRQSWAYSSEHSRSGQRRTSRRMLTLSNHSTSRQSRKISSSDATKLELCSLDSLPSNSNIQDTTLELLNLIKKRRLARATRRSSTSSLSPIQSRRRSVSSSPHDSRRSKLIASDKFSRFHFSLSIDGDEKEQVSDHMKMTASKSRYISSAIGKNDERTNDSDDTSYYSSSANSFHDDADAVDQNGGSESNLSEDSDDEKYEYPKSIIEVPNDRIGGESEASRKIKASEAVDAQQREKMNRMRCELEDLQQQVQQMEQRKATEMEVLKDFMQTKRNAIAESAKKKFEKQLESELESRLVAMDAERERIETTKDVLNKNKTELREGIAELNCNIYELAEENERLEVENKEFYRMHTHLTKWVKKTTKQNEKLEIAEARLKKIYRGSIALAAEEKLAALYRRCIYKVARGVNASDLFDFQLNEEIRKVIQEVENECDKEVISLANLDRLDEELEEKADALADFISSDECSESSESLSTFFWRSFRNDSRTLVDIYEGSEGSGSLSTSSRRSMGNESDFLEDVEEEDCGSETENGEDLKEGIGNLNAGCFFYENLLAKVSDNLDANQMSMLHENKDMLLSIFRFMDTDGSGDIDGENFKVGVELLNKRLPQSSQFQESEELFKLLDVDGNGAIGLSQFERLFD